VRLQGGGIHRDEYVDVVARREDFLAREVDLERAHARERSRGSADLGGKSWQPADVVARGRRPRRELHSGELHPVTGIAGETNDDGIPGLYSFCRLRLSGRRNGHRTSPCVGPVINSILYRPSGTGSTKRPVFAGFRSRGTRDLSK